MRTALVALILAGCGSSSETPHQTPAIATTATTATTPPAAPPKVERQARADHEVNPRLLRRFKPLRAVFADGTPPTAAQIQLGRMLYFDKRLSRDRDLSCNSCHLLDKYGVDNQPTSTGAKGQRGHRNSPTVYHAAGEFTNFWDGRAATVEEQAKGPILNPTEMAMASSKDVIATLTAVPGYIAAFRAAFPADAAPVSYDNVGRAIGAFERGLVTPSRWDRYLTGDTMALSSQEVDGLKLFTDVGCMTCHTGELVGGSMFQKVGVAKPWPNQRDKGRSEITKLASDDMVFKVPSLRNVAKTAPYFHDGSVASLGEAVRLMGRYQVGEELTDDDVAAIVAWLGALTGDVPVDYIKRPELPGEAPATEQRPQLAAQAGVSP